MHSHDSAHEEQTEKVCFYGSGQVHGRVSLYSFTDISHFSPMKEKITKTRLENKLTILTDQMQGVRSATLCFLLRKGARHEPSHLNGLTHFIEHTVFKGTARRSAIDIAMETDRLGGNLDAFTTHEETGFVIKVTDDHIGEAFDLLADMLISPRFDPADLENERRVIIEEIKMIEDSPEEFLHDLFYRELFPGQSLGRPITGTAETLSGFGHRITSEYHRKIFTPENLVITAAGNIEHETLLELAGSLQFARAEDAHGDTGHTSEATPAEAPETVPAMAAPKFIEHRPELEQAHLMLAVPIVNLLDERRYAAELLSNIIGGGTSSRLWQKIREQRGLAYSVGTSTAMFRDTGFLLISSATSPEQVEEVLDVINEEIYSIVYHGVTCEEIELMKQQARAAILLSLEDSAARAGSLAHSEALHGRWIPVEESLAKIEAVTTDTAVNIAREFFRNEKIALAAIGDLETLDIDKKKF